MRGEIILDMFGEGAEEELGGELMAIDHTGCLLSDASLIHLCVLRLDLSFFNPRMCIAALHSYSL